MSKKISQAELAAIKYNDRFSFYRDPHCWVLLDSIPATGTNAKPGNITIRRSYHANIQQVATHIMQREAGEAKSMKELINYCYKAEKAIGEVLNVLIEVTE
jgi:hypothetical protein